MKLLLVGLTCLVMLMVIPGAHGRIKDKGARVKNPTAILSTLREGHPRLIALESDISATKNFIQSDARYRPWYDRLKAEGQKILAAKPVEHKLDGPRLLTQSRLALDRLTLLGFLHRMEPDQRYVDRAVLEMETACAFPDWNPSHFLDTAEMTAAMGIGYDWFYHDLSPRTRATVVQGIIKLGLNPGLKVYRSNKGWVKGRNNWNQVCNGGMMIGALAIADEEPEIAGRILTRGKSSLAKGMKLFAPDGGWIEAPGYWSYTMTYTTRVFSALHTGLGSALGLDQVPGFSNTGNFMLAMEGPTNKYFNWGDCGEKTGNLPELFWLARRFDQPVIAWLGAQHMGNKPGVFDLLWYTDQQKPPGADTALDWYFGGIEVASMRQAWLDPYASFVAYKGGENAAPHSNLDLGSFVFDADGERWAIELGSDNYNLPDYWNKEKRLAYYRIRTEGQNTLLLNGENQDIKAEAKIIRRGNTGLTGFGIVDLTQAYAPSVTKAHRGFVLTSGPANTPQQRRHLVIQDELDTTKAGKIDWYMHTRADVSIAGNKAILKQGGKTAIITVIEPANAVMSVESAEQPKPQASNKGIRRIAISHSHQPGPVRIVVQISPGSAPAYNYQVVPLDNWK